MAEYIHREAALEYIIFGVVGRNITCGELRGAIEHLPTVEIVRCRECKWAYFYTKAEIERKPIPTMPVLCERMATAMELDDYCSYGERKE